MVQKCMRSIMHRSVCAISFCDYTFLVSAFSMYIQTNWQNPKTIKIAVYAALGSITKQHFSL